MLRKSFFQHQDELSATAVDIHFSFLYEKYSHPQYIFLNKISTKIILNAVIGSQKKE